MDIFKELGVEPSVKEPSVWVSRLAIFERAAPKAVPIRDVTLGRGVNIIWAQEAEQDDEAPITGHSAGKTTFCRLIRHCLGEPTFGTPEAMSATAEAFPEGQVAAEIHVFGRRLAVMRPIGKGVYSRILPDATIEELLQKSSSPVTLDTYVDKIGIGDLMARLPSATIAKTGEQVEWDHLLAWCTRDQEARFRSLHEWRSSRSQSDAASFRFKKAGPMLVMRMALGLYERGELEAEEQLAKLQADHDRLTRELDEAQREPQYLRRLHLEALRRHLADAATGEQHAIADRPLRSDNLEECLTRISERVLRALDVRIAEHEDDLQRLDGLIAACDGEMGGLNSRLDQLQAIHVLNQSGADEERADAVALSTLNNLLAEEGNRTCPHARVLIKDCKDIAARRALLAAGSARETHEQDQDAARREQIAASIADECASLEARVAMCTRRRTDLATQRAQQQSTLNTATKLRDDLTGALKSALEADDRAASGAGTATETRVRAALADTEQRRSAVITGLNRRLKAHDASRDLLARVFSLTVRSLLPPQRYDGAVSFKDRALAFTLKHGAVMTGEAVDTLSILLADVSCLIYNSLNPRSCLPGFLVHDSPREADLGLRLYHRFMRFVTEQQAHFSDPSLCPFQYIMTTTTPPPSAMQGGDFIRLKLDASVESELLYRRTIAVAPEATFL